MSPVDGTGSESATTVRTRRRGEVGTFLSMVIYVFLMLCVWQCWGITLANLYRGGSVLAGNLDGPTLIHICPTNYHG